MENTGTTKISSLENTLKVIWQGKPIVIDIAKELSIDENIINKQLKLSPSSYGILITLKNKAIKEKDKLEREKNRAFWDAYLLYKNSGVGLTEKNILAKCETNQKYNSVLEKYNKASAKALHLTDICKAYEGRERILQTISANIRKETFLS